MTQPSLNQKQHRAIRALIETGDVASAARAASVSRTSVYAWLKQPEFSDVLKEAEFEAIRQLSRQLVSLGKRATGVIAETLDDSRVNASTRVRAADIVLGRLLQLRELVDLEERLADVETRLAAIAERDSRETQNRAAHSRGKQPTPGLW